MDTLIVKFSFLGIVRSFTPALTAEVGLLIVTIGVTALAQYSNNPVVLFPAYVLLGVAVLVLLFTLVSMLISARRTGIAIQFTPLGIVHTRAGWPLIPWDDVSSLTTTQIGTSLLGIFIPIAHMLIIRPKHALPGEVETAADSSASFAISGLDVNYEEILQWLKRFHATLLSCDESPRVTLNPTKA